MSGIIMSQQQLTAACALAEVIGAAIDGALTAESRNTVAFGIGIVIAGFVESQVKTAPDGHRNEARQVLAASIALGTAWARDVKDAGDAQALVTQALKDAAKP